MDALHHYELEWIIALQHNVSMAKAMEWTSYLGWDAFIVLLPCIYLCINRRIGGALFLFYYVSIFVNSLTKFLLHSPRPYWLSDQVHAFAKSSSYGLPSGHAQMAVAGWFVLALILRKRLGWALAAAVVLAVSISRVYLGAHFVSDVAAGWVLGGILLVLFAWVWPRGESWVQQRSFAARLALSVAATLTIAVIGLIAVYFGPQTPDPPGWSAFSKDARRLIWLTQAAGGFLGASVGIALLERSIGMELKDSIPTRIFALAYGLAALYLLAFAYGRIAINEPEWVQYLWAFLRFCTVAWLIAFHAPLASLQMTRAKALIPHPSWVSHPSFARLQSGWERLVASCFRRTNLVPKT